MALSLVIDPEGDLQGPQGLPADPALEPVHHGDGRVARHQPGQHEIDGQAGPQGGHEETQAAQDVTHQIAPYAAWDHFDYLRRPIGRPRDHLGVRCSNSTSSSGSCIWRAGRRGFGG